MNWKFLTIIGLVAVAVVIAGVFLGIPLFKEKQALVTAPTIPVAASAPAPTVIATIPVGDEPRGIAVNPNTSMVYVANSGSDTVSVIDAATNQVVATIPMEAEPKAVGVDPATNRIYVTRSREGEIGEGISAIDGDTNREVGRVIVAGSLNNIAVNSNTGRVYVSGASLFGGGVLSAIDGPALVRLALVSVESGGVTEVTGVGIHPTLNRVYVAEEIQGGVAVFDGDTIKQQTTIPVGDKPNGVAVNSNTSMVYVANSGSDTVSVIDAATNQAVATIPVGDGPQQVAVNPNMNRVYVTHGDRAAAVSVIDSTTNKRVGGIAVGEGPFGVAVNPNTNMVYVANLRSDSISVILDVAPELPVIPLPPSQLPLLALALIVTLLVAALVIWWIRRRRQTRGSDKNRSLP